MTLRMMVLCAGVSDGDKWDRRTSRVPADEIPMRE